MFRRTVLALGIAAGLAAPISASAQDIVDVAAGNDAFSTLVAAVTEAGLVDTLKGSGPFTVFAPTNEAFEKLPAGTVETLLQPENRDQLVAILTYHVVPARVPSSDLAGQTVAARTVQGGQLTIDGRDGVLVNDATVTQADIEASNGIIHVVDTVILPPSE